MESQSQNLNSGIILKTFTHVQKQNLSCQFFNIENGSLTSKQTAISSFAMVF